MSFIKFVAGQAKRINQCLLHNKIVVLDVYYLIDLATTHQTTQQLHTKQHSNYTPNNTATAHSTTANTHLPTQEIHT
jgi:hypothetical protein